MKSWILRNVRIRGDADPADVAVANGKFVAVDEVPSDRPFIDAEGGLLLRPFVDSHHHLDKAFTLSHGMKLPENIFASIDGMSEYKRSHDRQVECVAERMVAVLQHLHAHGSRLVRAQIDVDEYWGLTGLRAAFLARQKMEDRMKIQLFAFAQHGITPKVPEMLAEAVRLGVDGLGGHTDLDEDWEAHLQLVNRLGETADLPFDIHVDETAKAESYRLPAVLRTFKERKNVSITHCISLACLGIAERQAGYAGLVEAGIRVNIAPSVIAFGGPLFPVAEALQAGVKLGIGSDNLRDLFVPTGSGNVLELGRLLGVAQRLSDPAVLDGVVEGMTNAAWDLATGEASEDLLGTEASFQVWKVGNPGALLTAPLPVDCLRVWRGEVEAPVEEFKRI
jgi:cytosine/adenosine deaminase-related metal-dependent hydrolase